MGVKYFQINRNNSQVPVGKNENLRGKIAAWGMQVVQMHNSVWKRIVKM